MVVSFLHSKFHHFPRTALALLIVGLACVFAAPATAAETGDLVKQAETELRNAERQIFNGKNDEAVAGLAKVSALLAKIKSSDASSPALKDLEKGLAPLKSSKLSGLLGKAKAVDPTQLRVKSVESKFEKLKNDIERRTGKPVVLPTESKAAAAPAVDPDALAKKIESDLRTSQDKMFNGRHQEAFDQLAQVSTMLAQLKAADPDNSRLKTLEPRFERQKKDVEKRMGKALPKPATPSGPAGATPAVAGEKLPSTVAYRLKKITASLDGAERALTDESLRAELRPGRAQSQLDDARTVLAETEKMYGDKIPPNHPEIESVKQRMTAVEGSITAARQGAADAKQQAEAADQQRATTSEAWVEKINPYVDFYGEKRLLSEPTGNIKNMMGQVVYYQEAQALQAQLKTAEFPSGRTDEIKELEEKLEKALREFPAAYEKSLEGFYNIPEEKLEEINSFIARQAEAQKDPTKTPLPVNRDQMANARAAIDAYAALLPPDDPKVAALNAKMAKTVEQDAAIRRLRIKNTFMIPDRYKGKDVEELKAKANELLMKKHADAKILRTTIISSDWKEEDVVEFTDTTKTAIHRRITRNVHAQVAAKVGDQVLLYTVYIGKNKRSDDTWGELFGNLHQTADLMLEENVNKKGP